MSLAPNLRISKILGALLGVHSGDSLGATLEFKPWSHIIQRYPNGLRDIIGGGSLDWPAGHATDDTDLTRAVLLAYRDSEVQKQAGATDFNIARSAAEYSLQWRDGDWPARKKGSLPIDIGNATELGLHRFKMHGDTTRSGAGHNNAGNGSLMRCIPTALFVGDAQRRVQESIAISEFTHNDRRCTVSCAAYNEIVAALVEGRTVGDAIEEGKKVAGELKCEIVVKTIEEGQKLVLEKVASEGPKVHNVGMYGYVLDSLRLAVAALLDTRSFEDVLVDVVRIGGDADTNGAIAGGVLGARDGVESIPERWLEKLQFREEFEEVTKEIIRLQGEKK